MAVLRPFRGLRYSDAAGSLATLVAPPYDVLSPADRDELFNGNEYNVVGLTLPEQNEGDRSKYIKYTRSAARLEQWRANGTLQLEPKPAFYRYRQSFNIPGSSERFDRMSLITTIKVEPYEKGVVLPHEQTFPKHKEDRLRILEATRAHLECIYGLIEDPSSEFYNLVMAAAGEEVANVTTPDGVSHAIDLLTDPDDLAKIEALVNPKKVWIADGHHRYETAVTFRGMQPATESQIPEDFMMMAISSISDPGLVLLPTHRMLKRCPLNSEEMVAKLRSKFKGQEIANAEIPAALEKHTGDEVIFGVAFPGGQGYMFTGPRPTKDGSEAENRLAGLDVTVLHETIFAECLGLTGHDFFDYTRDPQEALDAVENGAPASFLMNPPSVDDMQVIAQGGEKMPQKSTFYYPKILSGLVLWSLNDFEK